MEYGEKIAALRKQNGMTQADLGEKLNVTYQAVSKWERNESDPSFEMMSRIAKLFNVPLSFFDDGLSEIAPAKAEPVRAEPAPEAIGVCTVCGKMLYNGEAARTAPAILCRSCLDLQNKRRAEAERAERIRKEQEAEVERLRIQQATEVERYQAAEERAKLVHRRNKGLIVAGIVTAILLVISIVVMIQEFNVDTVIGSVVILVFSFTFTSQMVWGGIVRDVCLKGGVLIGTPGVIFTLDLDGVIFLIVVKILFAVLKLIIFLFLTLLFVCVSIVISPFTFIPKCIKVCRGTDDYDD